MNTEERAAHLASIRANPDEDLPRLVYADRLDENAGEVECPIPTCGNPAVGWDGFYKCRTCKGTGRASNGNAERAELIRGQCDIATKQRDGMSVIHHSRFPWVDSWLTTMEYSPIGFTFSLDGWVSCDGLALMFRFDRGFISRVELPFDLWLKHADAILSESVGLTVKLTTHPIRTHLTSTHLMFVGDEKRIALPWVIPHEGYESAYDDILVGHLRHRWPDVKAWELPERPDDMRRRMRDARREQGLPVQDEPFRVPPTVAPY